MKRLKKKFGMAIASIMALVMTVTFCTPAYASYSKTDDGRMGLEEQFTVEHDGITYYLTKTIIDGTVHVTSVSSEGETVIIVNDGETLDIAFEAREGEITSYVVSLDTDDAGSISAHPIDNMNRSLTTVNITTQWGWAASAKTHTFPTDSWVWSMTPRDFGSPASKNDLNNSTHRAVGYNFVYTLHEINSLTSTIIAAGWGVTSPGIAALLTLSVGAIVGGVTALGILAHAVPSMIQLHSLVNDTANERYWTFMNY